MFRGTNLTIEKHSGGKSTWSHLLARCSWASHCTPLSFSFLFCKKISHPANNMYWIKLNCFAWNSVLSTTSLPNLTFHLVLPEAPFFQPLGLCSCCCLGQNALLPPPCLTSTSTDPPYLPDFSMPTLFFFLIPLPSQGSFLKFPGTCYEHLAWHSSRAAITVNRPTLPCEHEVSLNEFLF